MDMVSELVLLASRFGGNPVGVTEKYSEDFFGKK